MVRLKAKYDFKIDDELKEFVKYNSKILLNISNYKIKEELDKMFSNQNKLEAIKILDELNISDVLNLHTKNIKYTKDIMGIYAQLNNLNLPFTKLEKDTIIKIQEILKQNKIDNNILYKYGLYICTIAGEILGINTKDINKMFNKLPIKSKNDIKINIKNLVKLNNGDEAKIVYNGKTYIYSLSNSYEVEKTGRVEISRNINKQTLTLITCKHNTNKQIVFVFELKNII